jgi:hypothetical protein
MSQNNDAIEQGAEDSARTLDAGPPSSTRAHRWVGGSAGRGPSCGASMAHSVINSWSSWKDRKTGWNNYVLPSGRKEGVR